MEERVLRGAASANQLARQHVLPSALDNGSVGGDVGVGSQDLHSVPAQAHVTSTISSG